MLNEAKFEIINAYFLIQQKGCNNMVYDLFKLWKELRENKSNMGYHLCE